MQINLVSTHQLVNGETLTNTDIVQVDGLATYDFLLAPGTLYKNAAMALTAALLRTCYVVSSQPVSLAINGVTGLQTVTITGGATGGTFTLTYSGQTTAGIAWNAAASTVQTALQALSSIGAGNVAVSGNAGGPWTVQFVGTLAVQTISAMTGSGGSLTGGSPVLTIAVVQAGATPTSTRALNANAPLMWALQDGYFSNPFPANITTVAISNPGASTAKVSFRFGQNAS